jgi:F-type H+-transporting ATPase subunit b
MLIDWFTVGAQAINFILLVWLLKHFLYKPILNALETREKRIATELAQAGETKTEAQKLQAEYKLKNEQFDQQRAELLNKASQEVSAERQRLLGEATAAGIVLAAERRRTLLRDVQSLNETIRSHTQQQVFAITRKALTELAAASLEERIAEVFIRRLRALGGNAKSVLADAIRTATEPALVCSAFDLPAVQRAAFQNALNETFSADVHLRFETAPDLISGVELSAGGQKIAWSIADYLTSMQRSIEDLVPDKGQPVTPASPEPTKVAVAPKRPVAEASVS